MNDFSQRKSLLGRLRSALVPGMVGVGVFSAFINILMLSSPLFMMQVYDRVLISYSVETLIVLLVMFVILLGVMAVLDGLRGQILARLANRFDTILSGPVFDRVFGDWGRAARLPLERLSDVSSVRTVLGSNAMGAVFDAPWVPIYLVVTFLIHPIIGVISTIGAFVILVMTIANQLVLKKNLAATGESRTQASRMLTAINRNAEIFRPMGMLPAIAGRWGALHERELTAQTSANDGTSIFTAAIKFVRFGLQMGILAAGAWLAILQEVTPGTIIAASVMMGRALAPLEQAAGNWQNLMNARAAWQRLKEALAKVHDDQKPVDLPAPAGRVRLEKVYAAPMGAKAPVLKGIDVNLEPGQALGVVGPSAAGKSTLARVLVGALAPIGGSVRIDGAEISQWRPERLGQYIGYLPQTVELLPGTVAQNIARFDPEAADARIIAAAQTTGVHDMIVRLPDGYDTDVGEGGSRLSGGQRQLVGLARAFYGEPVVIVLDEPNSNLDQAGDQALEQAIVSAKQRNATVVVMAHRPQTLRPIDTVMVLIEGQIRDLGPKEEVLQKLMRSSGVTPAAVAKAGGPGGPGGA